MFQRLCVTAARRSGGWFGAAAAVLLASCASAPPHKPYEGADAARLRVLLVYPPSYKPSLMSLNNHVQASVALRPVHGTTCGNVSAVPALAMYHGAASRAQLGPAGTPGMPAEPVKYPRADMWGATEPENSESAELKLSPGLHVLTFSTTYVRPGWRTTCPPNELAVRLEPKGQYQLAIGFSNDGKCYGQYLRMEPPSLTAGQITKRGGAGEVCNGNQYRP